MKKIRLFGREFSKYGLLPVVLIFLYNSLVYAAASFFTRNGPLHSLATEADGRITLVPWTVVIYFGSYLFWGVNYLLICRKRETAYRFLVSEIFSRTVCLVCYLAFPTTIARPEVTGEGLWNEVVRYLYRIDAPVNLFPSIHCLVSWNCYIWLLGDKAIPRWYRGFSLAAAVLIMISTLTTRQHVMADAAGGVLLAQVAYLIGKRTECWRYVERELDQITDRLLSGRRSTKDKKGASAHRFL